MADLYINGVTTSKARGGNNQRVFATGTRDGALYVADYILAAALEGRLFNASVGALTTPATFRIGITTLQPELVIDVPSGTTMLPVTLAAFLETVGGTITELVAMTGQAVRGAGTSSAFTPLSTRTDRPAASLCSVYYTYSGNAAAMSGALEFWREGFAWVAATAEGNPFMKFVWDVRERAPQVIVGPGSLSLYLGATTTAPTGFLTATWLELPSSSV